MSFKGDLSTIGLAEVFQMISMSQKEGTLVVQDVESRKAIYFGKEGVQLHSAGKRKGFRIGDILVRAGKISVGQLRLILERQQGGSRKMIGEELIEQGLVTEQEIQDIVKAQIEEEIYDLFLWRKASFEFIEGPPVEELQDPETRAIKLAFDVNSLLLEAVRRTDEWALINQKIPSMDSVFVFSSPEARDQDIATAAGPARSVYPALDGEATVDDIVEQSLVARFEVCKIVIDLLDRGRIRLLTPAEFVALARRRLEDGRREKGLKLFQVASQLAPEDPDLIGKYAHALETEGMIQDAARMYVRVGGLLKQQGEGKDALAYFQRAVSLNPDDMQSKVALFEINLATASPEDAVATANELVANCVKERNFEMAREIAEQAVKTAPRSLEMRLALARVYQSLGLKKERDDVLLFLRKNLPVDQAEADKMLAELRELSEKEEPGPRVVMAGKRRGSRRRMAALILWSGSILAACSAVILFVMYEIAAREHLVGLLREAGELAKKEEWIKAKEMIFSFQESKFRFSLFSRGRMQEEFDAMQKRMAAVEAAKLKREGSQGTDPVDKENTQRDVRAKMVGIKSLYDSQNWDDALARAQEALDLATKANLEPERDEIRTKWYDRLFKDDLEVRTLKKEAEDLERVGQYERACETVARLHLYIYWKIARETWYPLAVFARPSGVKIFKQNELKGESAEGGRPLVLHLKRGEGKFTLRFEKEGLEPKSVDVKDEKVGRVDVQLSDRVAKGNGYIGASLAAAPVASGGEIYLLTSDGVYAMDTEKLRLRWKEAATTAPRSGPGGLIFFGAEDRVLGIDGTKADGLRRTWEFQAEGAVTTAVCFSGAGDTLYFGCGSTLMAVRYATRELLWKKTLPGNIATPLESGGVVFVPCEDGILYACDKYKAEARAETGGPIRDAPALVDGTLYVGSGDGCLYAIDAVRGGVKWKSLPYSGEIAATPCAAGNLVYAASTEGWVFCVDAAGKELWRRKPGKAGIRAGVVAAASQVLVGDMSGVFHCLDALSGEPAWKYKTNGAIRAAAAVVKSCAYVASDDKNLYVLPLD